MIEKPEHEKSNRLGFGCVVVLLLLPVLYVASPPLVAFIFGGDVFEKTTWLWWPIVWLELNAKWYTWYLELWPRWIWD